MKDLRFTKTVAEHMVSRNGETPIFQMEAEGFTITFGDGCKIKVPVTIVDVKLEEKQKGE